ncbi:hypothetical protein H2204_000841 [Knufia peltigerae]|uniref:Uncharacterized protein n=1 Tax=Knufia peltigerae TaxID=1002370 RepID=A0AA38YE82_9EURO|nr:hypothetical protein H2204_000841 [Knufia peltigerae]
MSGHILPEHEPQIQPRNPYPIARPGPVPDFRLDGLFVEEPVSVSLVARSEASKPSSSSSSKSDGGGGGGSSDTLPILLGVLVPLAIAGAVFFYLHRRHVRKLRQEDAEDKHKSLDFGLNITSEKSRGNGPQMSENPSPGRRARGLSIDLGMHNPYLLPPEVHQSRESLHSLSRLNTGDDKYRATTFIPDDGSIRPPSSHRSPIDDSSSYTSSMKNPFDSKQNLLYNGQGKPMGGRSDSVDTMSPTLSTGPNNLLAPNAADAGRDSYVSTTSSNGALTAMRASNNYLGQFISGGNGLPQEDSSKKVATATVAEIRVEPPPEDIQPPSPAVVKEPRYDEASAANVPYTSHQPRPSDAPSITVSQPEERQPRLPQLSFIDSQGVKQNSVEPAADTQMNVPVTNGAPEHPTTPSTDAVPETPLTPSSQYQDSYVDDYYDEYEANGAEDYQDYLDYEQYLGYDPRRSMMGMRPLPPEDPSDNPEQRANRIRSFYKEYFDESKPHPPGQYQGPGEAGFDNYHDGYYDAGAFEPPRQPYGRHRAMSNGSFLTAPRAFSSASGRFGPPPSMRSKKRLPPPKPLNVLPTPHLLDNDNFLPADFAPPKKFQNQRAGTPDSLRGGVKQYKIPLRPHVPLASSFDDLAVIPSPHALRRSGTFTALDFAPPGRLGVADSAMSETGSIRSNRSGISAMHNHSIRSGAYRVSRIPKEVAGTKNELFAALRPQWDLNR